MAIKAGTGPLHQPILAIARKDFAVMRDDTTVQQVMDDIRSHGIGERIIYFYVVDSGGRLVGVIPTRRLLAAPLNQRISSIMIDKVLTVPETATVLDAHEILAQNKLLALPIVDNEGQIKGVIDVGMFTNEDFDIQDRGRIGEIFELLGFRYSQVRDASPIRSFRFRFPWLLATILSGTVCAVLTSFFNVTLAKSLVLAFFMTLVLGLGESVSMQSMTVAIHALRIVRPTARRYFRALRREFGAAFLLGAGCGIIVGLIVWFWHGNLTAAISIGGSILLVILAGIFWGLSIPFLLHALKLDPKIAAGPITLALADMCTIFIYFGLAMMLL